MRLCCRVKEPTLRTALTDSALEKVGWLPILWPQLFVPAIRWMADFIINQTHLQAHEGTENGVWSQLVLECAPSHSLWSSTVCCGSFETRVQHDRLQTLTNGNIFTIESHKSMLVLRMC